MPRDLDPDDLRRVLLLNQLTLTLQALRRTLPTDHPTADDELRGAHQQVGELARWLQLPGHLLLEAATT
jgi:hypothetical protein